MLFVLFAVALLAVLPELVAAPLVCLSLTVYLAYRAERPAGYRVFGGGR